MQSETFGPEEFAEASGVSRETLGRLKTYAAMLEDWGARQNLISRSSYADMWRRHFWDSAQLAVFIPDSAKTLVDLGSGAGFPGLVLAELFRERQGFKAVLYEATAKKCRFLEAVAAELQLPVEVRNARIEAQNSRPVDVITARALAALPDLIDYAQGFWGKNTVGLFLKGQNVDDELTQARKSWNIKDVRHLSLSDPSGVILEIRELYRGTAKPSAD